MSTPEPWMGWFLIAFSALSAIMGVLYTTAQRDLKRLLGYSSTENVGIAGIGFGLGYLGLCWNQPALVMLGFTGGILHILNHALFKCLLFYAAGSVYRSTHIIDMERLGGLARSMPWTAGLFLLGGLAISALPPLNGFVSEFLIYAGLLSHAAPTGLENVGLVCIAALLALVGGTSALAMARAFGVAFLGSARDPSVHSAGESPVSMRVPMLLHGAGVIILGLFPWGALRLVEQPAALFTGLLAGGAPAALPSAVSVLPAVTLAAWLFLGLCLLLFAVRWWLGRKAPATRHVTWGCGYSAVSPRMQYTGTSFSSQFAAIFQSVLVHLRRAVLPRGPFPEKGSHLNTHCVDAVERRMFEVLGEGEGLARQLYSRVSERPSYSFGIGLLVLVLIVGFVVAGGGHP
jgi:hydrogenase-4 component B